MGLAVPVLGICGGFKGDELQSRREKPGVTDLYPQLSEIHFPVLDQGHKHTSASTGVGSQPCDTFGTSKFG